MKKIKTLCFCTLLLIGILVTFTACGALSGEYAVNEAGSYLTAIDRLSFDLFGNGVTLTCGEDTVRATYEITEQIMGEGGISLTYRYIKFTFSSSEDAAKAGFLVEGLTSLSFEEKEDGSIMLGLYTYRKQ